jgi:cell division protease FtsH
MKRSTPWFLVVLFWIVVLYVFFRLQGVYTDPDIPYTQFKRQLVQGNVKDLTVKGDQLTGTFKERVALGTRGTTRARFSTTIPSFGDPDLTPLLEQQAVTVTAEPEETPWLGMVLINFLPWLLILGLIVYSSKKMQEGVGGPGGMWGFGRSTAKRYHRTNSDTHFADVAGLGNAKRDLQEIIAYLRNPSKFTALGAKLPKGILLVGPPGTGKTLLARACAGEADVPFFSISGSEFIEMFVGVGASRVRDMFHSAKKESPAIIFIDEIDSIGRARGTGLGGGHDEREQTLNQILAEMDGFSPRESVVVMAATNRPDVLDPALIRPGRFDRQVTLEMPHRKAREAILRIHTREVPAAEDVDLQELARGTIGFSGAQLQNLVNEATLLAGRKNKSQVEAEDFDQARDKILLGSEREDLITDEEKRTIAYHEAGHALMAWLLPGADPLRKVTITRRGHALGATEQLPKEDRYNLSRTYLLNRIAVMLGGRVAEKIVFNDVTSGAANDLKQATQLARHMVCQWGMSEKLGPVTFRQGEEHRFLGRELVEQKDFSEQTAREIDEEIQRIIQEREGKAEETLRRHRQQLETLATTLLENETVEKEEVDTLLGFSRDGGQPIRTGVQPTTHSA